MTPAQRSESSSGNDDNAAFVRAQVQRYLDAKGLSPTSWMILPVRGAHDFGLFSDPQAWPSQGTPLRLAITHADPDTDVLVYQDGASVAQIGGYIDPIDAGDLTPLLLQGRVRQCVLWMCEHSSRGWAYPWVLLIGMIPADMREASAEIFGDLLAWRAERAWQRLDAQPLEDLLEQTRSRTRLDHRFQVAGRLAEAFQDRVVVHGPDGDPDACPVLADARSNADWRAGGYKLRPNRGHQWGRAVDPDGRIVALWARSQIMPAPA